MDMNYMKVEGRENLIRDPRTNSIINTDMTEYQQYLSNKKRKSEENEKIQNIEEDIVNMKGDLDEIKFLLRSLVNGNES